MPLTECQDHRFPLSRHQCLDYAAYAFATVAYLGISLLSVLASRDFGTIIERVVGVRHIGRSKELHHPHALCNAGADQLEQDSFIPGLRELGCLEPCRLFDAICGSRSQQEQEEQDIADFQKDLHFRERFDSRLLEFRWPIRTAGLF